MRRGSDNRRSQRIAAPRVSLRTRRLDAEVLNLSSGGVAIETTATPPRIGAELLCELENEHTTALVEGEIRWCRLDGTASNDQGETVPVYHAGIRFTNGSPRNLLRILRAASLHRPRGEA